ncbi:MAG: CehA/McbA family metallohydrolase [Acidobacteriota bacterium]
MSHPSHIPRFCVVLTALLPPLFAGCLSGPSPESIPPPEFLSPVAGATLTHDRVDVGIVLPADRPPGHLEVWLGTREVSSPFAGPFRRMRSLGGESVATLTVEMAGETAGPVRLRAVWVTDGGGRSESTRTVRFAPAAAQLDIQVVEDDTPVPARIWFEGLSPTPTPDFGTPGADRIDPRERDAHPGFLDTPTGRLDVRLAPGRYELTATRGIEYSVARQTVEVRAGSRREVEMSISHVVPTPGWIGADLHVHATPSMDSFVPLEDRVTGYLAAGVEILVASDHHVLTDYAPVIASIPEASGRIRSLIGVEAGLGPRGSTAAGHWTLLPFAPSARAATRPWPRRAAGEPAAPDPGVRAGEDRRHPAGIAGGIIEVNHPRGIITVPGEARRGTDIAAWFETAGFTPLSGRSTPNDFLLHADVTGRYLNKDFDAIEILNRFSLALYREVRQDWFALLDAGMRPTGTANSDSHHRVLVGPGFPRNLVAVGPESDIPATFRRDRFLAALRTGAVVGTTGPVIDLEVGDDRGPGETVNLTGRTIPVHIRVRAAGWIPVREVRVIVNGDIARRIPLAGDARQILRLDTRFDLEAQAGDWLLVEAGDPADGPDADPGPVYRLVAPGFSPLAFTNPVFVSSTSPASGAP